MDLNKNYYNILDIDKNSTKNDIKKNFRKKAIETHPDKHGGNDLEFKNINEAYQILNDETKKNEYDLKSPHGNNYDPNLNNGFFGGPFGGFNVNFNGGSNFDPFEMFFHRKSEFHEELDITLNVSVTLENVYNNDNISIKYKRFINCDQCNGTGFDPNSESFDCDVCDGKGRTWESPFGFIKCKYCQGSGKINTGTCKKCNGEKVIEKEEEFNLNNTYKIGDSDTKYIRGFGHQSRHYNNKKGNLILNINYEHNNNYKRDSNDLYYKLNVHYEDAINGGEINYNHLDGKIYKLKILKKTKDGDKLKMVKKGLLKNNNQRNDLIININIIIDYEKIKL